MKFTPLQPILTAYNSVTDAIHGFFSEVNWELSRAVWRLTALLVALLMLGRTAVADPLDAGNQTVALIRDHLFEFSAWEISAVADKARAELSGLHNYLDEEQRQQFVRDYTALVNQLARLEADITRIYSNPAISDPQAASADLRAERDDLRQQQSRQQAIAEAIIESQISATLVDFGFGIGGQIEPPLRLRFTQTPSLLVISPRDHIERTGNYPLQHNLTIDDKEALETSVASSLDVSSLTVPLGGLAVYPAMLIETSNTLNIFDIGAHEWAHHYLTFYPLGFNFGKSPDLFTLNETVASIIGEEIGRATIEHYYPDLVPPPPPDPAQPPASQSEPPQFDFRAEMNTTRIQADALLAEGHIDEAETYMEQRRKIFVQNGYNIRKLNQAYFAFYGSYADTAGASGQDPVGPTILELRERSPSLLEFVHTMRSITSLDELQRKLDQLNATPS